MTARKYFWTDDQLRQAVADNATLARTIRALGAPVRGNMRRHVREDMIRLGLFFPVPVRRVQPLIHHHKDDSVLVAKLSAMTHLELMAHCDELRRLN